MTYFWISTMRKFSIALALSLIFATAAGPHQPMAATTSCHAGEDEVQTGRASWYGPGFDGRKTANGEVFNMHAMTAAHRSLKLGTRIQVENVDNGITAIFRVNDRGPYIGKRVLDVSRRGAEVLGFREDGLARVKIRVCADI